MSLAKGRTAIHTPGGLHFAFDFGVFLFISAFNGVEFFPIEDTAGRVAIWFFVALVVDKTTEFFDRLVGTVAAFDSVAFSYKMSCDFPVK